MKHCNKCDTIKELSEFNKRGSKHQAWCKSCISIHHKNRRKGREDELNAKNYAFEKIRKDAIEIKIVEYLKQNPCKICGESDLLVLDFDHLGDKEFNIATMIWNVMSWERIEKEIAKCQVLCSNCHRRKTAFQLNTWRVKYTSSRGVMETLGSSKPSDTGSNPVDQASGE